MPTPSALLPLLILILFTGTAIPRQSAQAAPVNGPEKDRSLPTPDNGPEVQLASVEGIGDTVTFHIGSPIFLRLTMNDGGAACEPFNGRPFYFDEAGAQVGWGFEEVADSLLFPRDEGSCERIIMLSSQNSNRLAEGYYTVKVSIFFDEKTSLTSRPIVLHPVHSQEGPNELSYARFLQEQILTHAPLLNDPETLRALFAEGVPMSPESEIYRALILYRGGDQAGAEEALARSTEMEANRRAPLSTAAHAVRKKISGNLFGTNVR